MMRGDQVAIWSQDKYLKAWNFASAAHQGQYITKGSDIPYINHIGLVAMEAVAACSESSSIENPDLLIACALLHDTIEDIDCTVEMLEATFGADVAQGVLALSKDSSLPSKREQMLDSLKRIKAQPQEIWMVKLCDRITNLQPPPKHWKSEKINSYRDEAMLIRDELGSSHAGLAKRLAIKIDDYAQYVGKSSL